MLIIIKGFCIEYDMSKQSEKDLFSRLTYPVIYGDELYDATSTIKKINDGKAFLGIQLPTLMKSSEWKYMSKEWRLIAPFNIMKAANNTFKTPVPIRVYLGARIDSNDEIKIRDICDEKRYPRWLKCEFLLMNLDLLNIIHNKCINTICYTRHS